MKSVMYIDGGGGPGEGFAVSKVDLGEIEGTDDQPRLYAEAIHTVLQASWEGKFTPDTLTVEEVRTKTGSVEDQLKRLQHPKDDGHYWLAFRPQIVCPGFRLETNPQAILRVETYKPANPFAKPYPNVTDIETSDGHYTGAHEKQAAALLYFSLSEYPAKVKTAAYSEVPNHEGIRFLENLGYVRTGNQPAETIGAHVLTYVHLEAPKVEAVTTALENQYPWISSSLPTKINLT